MSPKSSFKRLYKCKDMKGKKKMDRKLIEQEIYNEREIISIKKIQKDIIEGKRLKEKRIKTPFLEPIINGERKVSKAFYKIEDEICDYCFRIHKEYDKVIKVIGLYSNNGYKSLPRYGLEKGLNLYINFLERLEVKKVYLDKVNDIE